MTICWKLHSLGVAAGLLLAGSANLITVAGVLLAKVVAVFNIHQVVSNTGSGCPFSKVLDNLPVTYPLRVGKGFKVKHVES